MSRTIPVKGIKETMAFLEAFPMRIQKGAVRSGLTAAAKPVRDEARLNAARASGKMAKAIKTGSPKVEEGGRVTIKVRLAGPHSFLGKFIESGVAPHLIARTGAGQGRVAVRKAFEGRGEVEGGVMKIGDDFVSGIIQHPGFAAKPFMRPALDTKAEEAVQAFAGRIRTYLKDKTGFTAPAQLDEVEE